MSVIRTHAGASKSRSNKKTVAGGHRFYFALDWSRLLVNAGNQAGFSAATSRRGSV